MHVHGSRGCGEGTWCHRGTALLSGYAGLKKEMETYSTGNLDLVVDTASVRMVVCPILHVRLETRPVHTLSLDVRIHVRGFHGLWQVIHRWGDLAQSLARVPYLEHDIKDVAIDFPGRATENVEASIHELDIT
jgi:hypothetical protein